MSVAKPKTKPEPKAEAEPKKPKPLAWQSKPLTPEQQAMVEQFQPLVHKIAHRVMKGRHNSGGYYTLTFAELVSELQFALMRAVIGFDPNAGVKPITYIQRGLEMTVNHIASDYYRDTKSLRRFDHQEPMTFDERGDGQAFSDSLFKNEANYRDRQRDTTEIVDDREEVEILVPKLIKTLTTRERDILVMRYVEGLSLIETGRCFSISKERVRQIELEALWKCRGRIGDRPSLMRARANREYHYRKTKRSSSRARRS
jgi:RNA polymerase sigma factor (sigma-70 family)